MQNRQQPILKNSNDMKKFNIFTISFVLFFMASSFIVKAQVPGNGLTFDGDDDYITVPTVSSDELNPQNSITVECWVNLNEAPSATHTPYLVSRLNCYSLTINASGNILFYFRDNDGEWFLTGGTSTITTDKWYHLAATYDGATSRVFVNGEEENTNAFVDSMARTTANFRIGARNDTPNATNTNGTVDEVRVWNIARTRTDIRAAMNMSLPGTTAGLAGYWRLDESSGTIADGATPFDNDGTLTNMSVPGAWGTSTAPMGDASIFVESLDIAETSEVAVDVVFGAAPEGSGPGHSMAVMQVNELPNSTSGLYPDRAGRYWELWSEDADFDGNFTAAVRFHYDAISGLPYEPSLELFRRDDATGTWTEATGYSVVSNDGGSSSATDGVGYIELTITEASAGGFSGQYIISWTNEPPVVSNIPDQSVAEGSLFATINLDDYVADPDNLDSELTWTATGHPDFSVDITGRVATITPDDPEWNGSNVITFTAEDPLGESDSDDVTFEVTRVNDLPVVGDIPGQEIAEGDTFATIILDDFVADVDDDITAMIWTATGQTDLMVDITDRVATIVVSDPDWNGNDTITFRAEDPEGGTDSVQAAFTVTPVNDPPVVSDIPDQTIAEGAFFDTINLDDYVVDVDDADSTIIWSILGGSNVSVNITDRVVTIAIDDAEWNGSDTLVFTATDTSGTVGTDTSIFTVMGINDAPTLSIPISDTTIDAGTAFLFVLDSNTFADVEGGLVLSASMSMGGSTPAWITFDPATGTFSGTPADADKGVVEVIVTAMDDSLASVADTFNIEVKSYVGIVNPLAGLQINLYPNPNDGRFVIESGLSELKGVVLEIFNERGQMVWNRKITDETGSLRESVDLSDAADGLYMLRLRNKSGMISKRFVIGN
jgi:hypothetical protein